MQNHLDKIRSIVEHLKARLEVRDDVYAFWIEGSIPQGYADEYSDMDLWLSVDDDKIFAIYDVIEDILNEIAPIDFKNVFKNSGELGHNVYHLKGMSEFLTLDINTQKLSRNVLLTRGIDDAEIVFDKRNIVKFEERKLSDLDIESERKKLQDFYEQMRPNVIKNVRRGKNLEALGYYHQILRYVIKFLRVKYGLSEKIEYDLKHVYRDIPRAEIGQLEIFYDVKMSNIEEHLSRLKEWIGSL